MGHPQMAVSIPWVLIMGALLTKALLLEVYIGAPDVLKILSS